METARRFDGTNETEVGNWYRTTYGTWLTPDTGNFLLGVLSESENKSIAAGLNDVIMDHLVDAVDRDGTTELVFRSGSTKAIQPGSWIVNCTGYVMQQGHPYEPYVSGSGAVISITPAVCHSPLDHVYELLPDSPDVLGQDNGPAAV
jgi:hypothetical protein